MPESSEHPTMTMLRVPSKGASSDTQGEKQTHLHEDHVHALSTREVDTGAEIVAGLSAELDPAESARVRSATTDYIVTFRLLGAHSGRRLIITSSQ